MPAHDSLSKGRLPARRPDACQECPISIIICLEGVVTVLKKKMQIERPQKEKVTREQALKRVKAFNKRKEKLIAAIREGTHRDFHS